MVKGVIFDMDGLMFDTERLWDKMWEPACKALGLPLPEDLAAAPLIGLQWLVHAPQVTAVVLDARAHLAVQRLAGGDVGHLQLAV